MLETWNKINDDLIARNANKIWGTHNWTTPPPNIENQVAKITNAHGKIGVANTVTCIGQKKFFGTMEVNHTFSSNHAIALS